MNWIGMHQSANDLDNPNKSHPKKHFEVHHGPTYVIKNIKLHIIKVSLEVKNTNQTYFILVYYLCWFWSFFVLSRNSLRLLLILIKEWRIETNAAKLMKRATPIGKKNHIPLANLSVNLYFVSNVKGCNRGQNEWYKIINQ